MELNKEKLDLLNKYFSGFFSSMNNRSLSSIFFSDIFKGLLEWHYSIWDKETTLLSQDDKDLDTWSLYSQALAKLDAVLGSITDRVLSEGDMVTFYFFDQFPKHVEKYKEKKILVKVGSEHSYADYIMTHFYRVFFSKIANSPNNFNIWDTYFPKNWCVTSNPFLNNKPENIAPRITLSRFIEWAQTRISSAQKKEWDKDLDDVTENIFPGADPVRWSKILIFVLSSFDPKNRVSSVISRPWNFGFASRPRVYSGYEEDDKKFQEKFSNYLQSAEESEKKSTYQLALALFGGNVFTHPNLELFIQEAEKLEYIAGSDEEKKRMALLEIFRALDGLASH